MPGASIEAGLVSDGALATDGSSASIDPLVLAAGGAAALVVVGLGLVAVRRRRHWREGIPVSDAVPREALIQPARSIDDPVPFVPRLREFELGDEANMPRWLRPSVRAERFTALHTEARSSTDPVSRGDDALKEGSVDLDALFAARRSADIGAKPAKRAPTRRRRTAPS
jgi:hypothetical protein